MKVYMIAVNHEYGSTIFAGKTYDEVRKKLVKYCLDNVHDWNKAHENSDPVKLEGNDDEKVHQYFDYFSEEWCSEDNDEVPTIFDFFLEKGEMR